MPMAAGNSDSAANNVRTGVDDGTQDVPQSDATMAEIAGLALRNALVTAGVRSVASALLRRRWPWWSSLEPARLLRAELYVLSTLFNAAGAVVGVWCWVGNAASGVRGEACAGIPARLLAAVPAAWRPKATLRAYIGVALGYFAHDLALAATPAGGGWSAQRADVLHHINAVCCAVVALRRFGSLPPFLGPGQIMDASTVALNAMWFLREFGDPSNVVHRRWSHVATAAFVGLFASLRVVWVSWYLARTAAREPEQWRRVGRLGHACLALMQVLNLYWFALIVRKVAAGRGRG